MNDKGKTGEEGKTQRRGRKPKGETTQPVALRVVAGTEVQPGEVTQPLAAGQARNAHGLTARMEAFAEAMAAGAKTQADAYRAAYDVEGMSAKAIHTEASALMRRPEVVRRINAIVQAKQAMALHDAGETRRLVTRELLARISDPKNPPAVQLRALELLGKTVAMFTDRVEEAAPGADQGADAVQDALEARLAKLLQAG